MKMGNSKSRKIVKEPKSFFENEQRKQIEKDKEKTAARSKDSLKNKGKGPLQGGQVKLVGSQGVQPPVVAVQPPPMVPYDVEAIARMREQLKHDANAFLLNNIMLSVQFFDNYEKIMYDLTNNSVTKADVSLNEEMAQHHKHVLLPDKLQEALHSHSQFKRRQTTATGSQPGLTQQQALLPQRMFVVHDNVELNAPGEVSDYSTVLDAPFYRMLMEPCDEPGYVKLKKLEILENKANREETRKNSGYMKNSDYSSDSESESIESDTKTADSKEELTEGTNFMNALKEQLHRPQKTTFRLPENLQLNEIAEAPDENPEPKVPLASSSTDITNRRPSGILKRPNRAVQNGVLTHVEKTDDQNKEKIEFGDKEKDSKASSSYVSVRRPSGITKDPSRAVQKGALVQLENKQKRVRHRQAETKKISPSGSESSGYKSSPQYESSGNESDYGYATITAQTTPRRLEISNYADISDSTSVIPLKCLTVVEVRKASSQESDGEDDEIDKAYSTRYGADFTEEILKKVYYLNSNLFMANFSDLYLMKLARSLGFSVDSLRDALTQGASIYCKMNRGTITSTFEVVPALNTTWPSAADGWIIRPRNIIRNPRTNYKYQWPTQHMLRKARDLGCLVVPIGFRPTRGSNSQQGLQWRLTFPAVERYLETCLAHSQIRCYMFTVLMFKTFVKNQQSEVGLDHTHLRNHLFWQCEDNYAKWPEDRLGETLRIFLKSLYQNIMKGKMPDYFIPQCNILKGIPKTVLYSQQRKLADIIESPVMHLLSSLRNLKYVKTNFYPVLNYRKLYRILTTDDILRLMNPHLPRVDNKVVDEEESEDDNDQERAFWVDIKKKNPNYDWRVQQLRQREAKKAAQESLDKQNLKRDAIDRKKMLPSNLETNRRRLVLEMFIPHFLAMAECSDRNEATRQAMLYLDHANRLTVLLRDDPISENLANEYQTTIREKMEVLKTKVAKTVAPKVPKRNESINSNMERPGTSGINKMKHERYINLSNVPSEGYVARSYEPDSPTLKLSGVILADVHPESQKPKYARPLSFQNLEEESEGDSDVNESRL